MLTSGRVFLIIIIIGALAGATFYFLSLERVEEYEPPEKIETEVFDPFLLEWQEVTADAPWSPRDAHTIVVHKDKMWLMGGLNGNDFVIEPGVVNYGIAPHFSDIWVSETGYDWRLVTNQSPWGERRSMQSVVFKDKIWVIPGWGPKTGLESNIWASEDGINWDQVVLNGPWPEREGHQLAVFKDKLWLLGGVNYDIRKTKNDIWYSEDGISWVEAVSEAPWPSRWDHEVIAFKDKLWLIGGMDLNGNVYSDIWVSETGHDWELVTDNSPWPARQGHELVIFQDRIWIIGRFNSENQGGGDNDVWFSEDGINWQKTKIDPPWTGREDHSAIVFQDRIWVLGGMTIDWVWKNEIWKSTTL